MMFSPPTPNNLQIYNMKRVSTVYNKMLSEGKEGYERVGWGSLESQHKRFKILTEIADLRENSLLDVGCGLGALYEVLVSKYPDISYTGADINQNMINSALERHPAITFFHADLVTQPEKFSKTGYDYVFMSGALNLSDGKHEETIKKMMRAMFLLARKGVAVNFLSVFADHFTPGEYYCNPMKILELAFSLTHKVVMRHDYMSHDFTVYLYK